MTHAELVRVLAKPGIQILSDLSPSDCHVWHMASCIGSEAGELFDAIKKGVIYRKDFDRENIVEELGDIEFYLEGLRASFNISRDETLEHNKAKLIKRYQSLSFSNSAAQERADKTQISSD